jgi:hypothetical protein
MDPQNHFDENADSITSLPAAAQGALAPTRAEMEIIDILFPEPPPPAPAAPLPPPPNSDRPPPPLRESDEKKEENEAEEVGGMKMALRNFFKPIVLLILYLFFSMPAVKKAIEKVFSFTGNSEYIMILITGVLFVFSFWVVNRYLLSKTTFGCM